jgi:CRISPR-associated protein Csx17
VSEVHEIELRGCTPEPLMSYLKSLGILRLLSEQVNSGATGFWRNDCFVVSLELGKENLTSFFLDNYKPTPLAGPWAGGSGFFRKDNRKAIEAIAASTSSRATPYKEVIQEVQRILGEEGVTDKPSDEAKDHLLRRYRREMPELFVRWMDAAMALQSDGQSFAPLLGTGGNDGRLDFTQNFMQRLVELNIFVSNVPRKTSDLLHLSLFGHPMLGLGKAAVGQFAPGRAGGPNSSQGMEGGATDNPWDFVLMLEGAVMLAGSIGRRMNARIHGRASFPFTVRSRPVGPTGPSDDEIAGTRGEIWLPLWGSPTTADELQVLFAEGRADVSGRPAGDGIDFSRAVAGLGIDRGIDSFVRYGFLKRSGKAYLACALDRFPVPQSVHEGVDLLRQLDRWLDRYRRATREGPARLRGALRGIESAIYGYCRYGRRADLEAILIALGRAERELALTGGHRGDSELCPPCGRLSTAWLKAIADDSSEFAIALALAGMHGSGKDHHIDLLRRNLEPVAYQGQRWKWTDRDRRVVWSVANLSTNMALVLQRRMLDSKNDGLPLDSSFPVSIDSIGAYLAEETNDQRIEDLLWGLLLVDPWTDYANASRLPSAKGSALLPRTFALLKLLFLPHPLFRFWDTKRERYLWRYAREGERGISIVPEPSILPLIRSRQMSEACRLAYRRLRATGLEPVPGSLPSRTSRESDWEVDPSLKSERLAAALLIPLRTTGITTMLGLVTRRGRPPEISNPIPEGVRSHE